MSATMPPARRDPTADTAIARVQREESPKRLEVPISEWCGPQLLEAFVRAVGATFTGRAA